jgi:hypothetical protein
MGTHDYHDALPGYREGQLLVDGCEECERRGRDPREAINYMDGFRFSQAWERAAIFNNGATEHQLVGQISTAERPLLDLLWAIIRQLERRGIPITSPAPGSD